MHRVAVHLSTHSVTDQVRSWLQARPAIAACLDQGLVNLTALARRIQDDIHVERRDAVVTALRRVRDAKRSLPGDQAVQRALAQSRVEMRTHVAMLTYTASWPLLERLSQALAALGGDGERVHVFHGWEDLTVVADEALIEEVERALGHEDPLERRVGLVELNIRSDRADVPGFIATTSSALAERGINLIDLASCRQDHIFLIEEGSLPQAIDALDGLRRH